MILDKDEKRIVCEGCLTNKFYLCRSFPGQVKEKESIKKKKKYDGLRPLERVWRKNEV